MYNEIELKIKKRIEELEKIKEEVIEKLKVQQELAMKPIEVAIYELKSILSLEEEKEKSKEKSEEKSKEKSED